MYVLKPKKFKIHSLTGRVQKDLLQQAWDRVRNNKGAPGVDFITVEQYKLNTGERLRNLMDFMKSRSFKPSPLRRVYIPKLDGSLRPLGIPTVQDRIAQETIRLILEPIFEKCFHDDSFGFRPKRSTHDAIRKIRYYQRNGYTIVVDADISKCFDQIAHKAIMQSLAWEIADGNILSMIEAFLHAGLMEHNKWFPTHQGTPQGGPLSPLLANIVLNRMDWQLTQLGFHFVRYADDFVILTRSPKQAQEALEHVKRILRELGLEISEKKTRITSFKEGFDFLGFHLTPQTSTMRLPSKEKFKQSVKKITTRHRNLDKNVIKQLNDLIRGNANYFGKPAYNTKAQFIKLDQFIRRRVRCMKYKRIRASDNLRIPNKKIRRKKYTIKLLPSGQRHRDRPVLERCTPVNIGN